MTFDLFVGGLLAATLIALARWRAAPFLLIVFGELQDPVRKLTPGAPALMAISSLPIFCAACVPVLSRERAWTALKRVWPRVTKSMLWFLFSLVPATALLFRHGWLVWPVAVIGLFGYLAPVAALLAGFVYVRDSEHLRRLLVFYCLFTGVLMSGAFLEYVGYAASWKALGTAALGTQLIRWFGTSQVELMSGFYRSPDVMGWHAATLTMFALTLLTQRRRSGSGALWLALGVVGILACLVAGRRKMVMMPVIWCLVVLVAYVREGRLSRAFTILGAAGVAGAAIYAAAGGGELAHSYYAYAATSQDDMLSRAGQGAFDMVWETFRQAGPLGVGIGAASQGRQHVGLEQELGWQETGLSKLAAELGAFGLLCAVLLVVAIGRGCLSVLRTSVRTSGQTAIVIGLAAFVVANAASFLISHQVYGDPLVLVLTAFMIGVVLSAPRWTQHGQEAPPRPAYAATSLREMDRRGALA